MLYTYDYDNNYVPALPVVDVHLSYRFDADTISTKALVDSGADATMMPLKFLKQIRARKGSQMQVRGVAGFTYTVDTYRITLRVGPYQSRLMVVAARQSDRMILGRDVLNDLIVTLNGLGNVVEISQ